MARRPRLKSRDRKVKPQPRRQPNKVRSAKGPPPTHFLSMVPSAGAMRTPALAAASHRAEALAGAATMARDKTALEPQAADLEAARPPEVVEARWEPQGPQRVLRSRFDRRAVEEAEEAAAAIAAVDRGEAHRRRA